MNAIITVFDDELEFLKDYSLVEDIQKVAGRKFYVGKLNEQDIIFTFAPNSPLDAAISTQIMIDKFCPERIFFSGMARATVPYLNSGDIIIANYLVRPSQRPNSNSEMLESDQVLLQTLRTVCDIPRLDRPPHIFGTMMEWDLLSSDDPNLKLLVQEFGAIAIDSTAAALAYVCHHNRIPFIVIDIAALSEDNRSKAAEENAARSIRESFELKGLALVEMTLSEITSQM